MRVNMDSSVASDPRFELVAHRVGLDLDAIIGKCFRLWLVCYERRSERLRKVEVDVAARCDGFADALIGEKLADDHGDDVVIHGVAERIEFLNKQAERGRTGGQKGKGKRRSKTPKANAKQTLGTSQSDTSVRSTANTLTLTPDLALTQTPDQTPDRARDGAPRHSAGVEHPGTAFTVMELIDVIERWSSGRVKVGVVDHRLGPRLWETVEACGVASFGLGEVKLAGEWLAAGGLHYRDDLDAKWVAGAGNLLGAIAHAKAWDAEGRPAVRGGKSESTGQVEPMDYEDYPEPGWDKEFGKELDDD